MATLPADASVAPRPHAPARDRGSLFVIYAWTCLTIAVGGFIPSFWWPIASGGVSSTWLVITHGVLFTGWAVLFLSQTLLVEKNRIIDHRAWGFAGVSLASMLFLLGLATAVASLDARLAAGFGDRARAFTIVPVSSILMFFGFFAAAIANVARSDWHKRLMMIATAVTLVPALARLFFVLLDGRGIGVTGAMTRPGTALIALRPASVVFALLVVTAIADTRRRGALHPAWIWGIGITSAVALLRIPMSTTPQWYAVADWLVAFG